MAEKIALVENYLSCHVCSETFKDPVTLKCNHNFCSSCLQEFWRQNQNQNCPICKRKCSKNHPPVNFSLKELADSFAGRPKSRSSETGKHGMEVCLKHPGEVKLFCKDEQRPVCPVCEFSQHQSHKVVSVEEAVRDLKEELKSDIKSLTDKSDVFRGVEEKFELVIQHFERQQLTAERQIRAEFNKLHQFLREEEESRVSALREEKEQKRKTVGRAMKKIQDQMSSLSESIAAIKAELQKSEEAFLSTYKGVQNRARTQSTLTEPRLLSGALIDVAKHVGNLSFRVWEKMREKVHFHPVLLDPKTAHGSLLLSEDLTGVEHRETSQELPGNPERNSGYPDVLGSEGFSSGRHSWEVEVGDHPYWIIGVVNESINRKGKLVASPECGIWCLSYRNGKYTRAGGKTVIVKKSLQKISIQLNYEKGKVTFSSSEDMTDICSYKDTFTEKLFPYFFVGKTGTAKTSGLRICPTQICQ
ncbi:nuclear factor 7, brain-like [Oryzias melastigma]|uniref:nuclear factor 7, brain-like n=1 Tax=Oryzias melastigma TaxID=30732 RepID=UPI000CF829B4|nr:nuclear factor 7, brain-like [Oryzias melastigma]